MTSHMNYKEEFKTNRTHHITLLRGDRQSTNTQPPKDEGDYVPSRVDTNLIPGNPLFFMTPW
jgi:hypothetical protein